MQYRIELAAPLSPELLQAFAGFSPEAREAGTAGQPTAIIGDVTDQSDLFSVLDRIESLGLHLVSVNPVPDRVH
jgi:hypothetical protein